MRHHFRLLLTSFSLAGSASGALAQPNTPAEASSEPIAPAEPADTLGLDPELDQSGYRFHSLSLKWDNDGSVANPFSDSDRNYTNGAKIDLAWTPPTDWAAPDWWTAGSGNWSRFAVGVNLTQEIYTAADLTNPNPGLDERPYAGLLTLGLYAQRASDTVHDHAELRLGLVGPWSGAEAAQEFVHSALPVQDDPGGWGTQLANEPMANARFVRTWKTVPPKVEGYTFELLPSLSADAGTILVQAGVDLTLRIGPSLPDDFGPGRVQSWRDATGTGWDTSGWKWYAYARVGARAVAWNVTLDGNLTKDSRSVSREPLVGEAELGLRARYDNIEFGYQLTTFTREFADQDGTDSYGEFTLTFYF